MRVTSSRPSRFDRHTFDSRAGRRLIPLLVALTTAGTAHGFLGGASARAQNAPAARAREIPESLNFANGLFRERRYELAAKEYERFLKEAQPGLDADDARFGLANARLFQGEYAKARREFELFLDQAPEHPNVGTAWYRVGETAYMLGDLPAARRAFENYTRNFPTHKHLETAWPYLGDVCLRLGDLASARAAYEKSLADFPSGRLLDRARFGLGRALALEGKTDDALNAFANLAEKGGKEWTDRAWIEIGKLHVAARQDEKAIEAFEQVEALAPKSSLIGEERLFRAEALLRLDRRNDAEPLLRALFAEAPQNLAAQAAYTLGTAQLEKGDPAEALATFDAAIPRFEQTRLGPALIFRSAEAAAKLGKADDARARFLRAAEADPKDEWADDALYRAARLTLDQRDPEAAAKLADQFVDRYPNSPLKADARLVSALAALALNRPKDAIATLTSSLADDKPSPTTAEAQRYYLGIAYRADGQSVKAAELLDGLARTSAAPIVADAQFMLGQGHMESRQYAEAIPPLEKYLATKPNGDVADFALAHLIQARLELGEADAAVKALEQLAERFPKSKNLPPSRVRVAEAAMSAGQTDRAVEQFRLAAAESTDPAVAARARLGLGWALLDGGKPEEAAEAFAAFLDAHADDPLAPEAALARARAFEAAKKVDPALEAYEQAAARYPKADSAPLAAIARARLLVSAGRPADAAAAFAAFIEANPEYAPKDKNGPGLDALLADWGWALIDADKPEEADKVFNRLLESYPESPHAADARFNLAESANQARKPEEVVRLLTPLVAEGSKASPRLIQSALFRLGRTQAETQDWPAAAASLDRLLKEYPEGTFTNVARLLRAEVALEAGDSEKADTILAELATVQPDPARPEVDAGFTRAVRRRKIQALLALKKWKEVVDAADAFKTEAPDDPMMVEVDYARGRALQQLARFDESRAAYQAVITARKGGDLMARAQFMMGETYYHQKDYHEAIRQYLKVEILYDAPLWQAAALLEAGKAYEQLAQWDDAAESYERLRAKFPTDARAGEAKTRLDAVRKQGAPAAEAKTSSEGESLR